MTISTPLTRLPHAEGLPLPQYATAGSAGADLCAAVELDTLLAPMERMLIPTGIMIALPQGYEAQIRPRSGLAYKNGITVLNSPGTIDSDYRGEIKVLLVNLSKDTFAIQRGMRIAQLIIAPVTQAVWEEVPSLDNTARAAGGFGSTGA